MTEVSVVPAAEGWAVRSDAIDNEMIFKSGARAEAAARRVAQALAAAGQAVKLRVHLRDGTLAGRFVVAPPPEPAGA
ncbi:DUF2188 domain-containing protein [Phenylobacterium sp.]|uniref:DUF2188 domain-containing protein n=1 Tax=Phenylobacterium sp. TaxID=1871053 RepID=UPI003919F8E7